MGNHSAFWKGVGFALDTLNFDIDRNVSVFETTIRVLGGLLSAHLAAVDLQARMPTEPLAYTHGLLDLALDLGRRLMPAFETTTGKLARFL